MKKLKYILPFAVITFSGGFRLQTSQSVTVVAAANLKTALDSILVIYRADHPGQDIKVTYGSSGKFYEQISKAAPFDVFFSADMSYPKKLKDNKLAISNVKLYAVGQIVLWSKKLDPNSNGMNTLADVSVNKISIANPQTAPYGARAVESMKYYKLYDKLKSKLVYGDNIAQASQFVAVGAAEIGIIALSEALSPNMKKEGGKYYLVPESSHSPLDQGCVILKHGKDNVAAKSFYDFISDPRAVAILTYFGYTQKAQVQ